MVRTVTGTLGDAPAYEIVAGERRRQAAQLAGLTHVPVVIRDLSDRHHNEHNCHHCSRRSLVRVVR